MSLSSSVRLELYHPKYDEILNQFSLPEEQVTFTALPKEMLKEIEKNQNETSIVITADSVPVGFFVLHAGDRVKEYTDHPHSLLLIAFSIDYYQQGKGYAKKGLSLLHDFVSKHFPTTDEIVLAVNMKNIAARQLYEKIGFQDRGGRKMGPKGEQLILHLSL
nr:GNAT family N-acetyltransferase [Hazenella coriacea]